MLYRMGRYDAAVEALNEAVKAHGKGGSGVELLFLAMAHHHLGHAEEARQAREKALAWGEQHGNLRDSLSWVVRREWCSLQQEAEQILKGKPAAPQK